jgi:MFS family permease
MSKRRCTCDERCSADFPAEQVVWRPKVNPWAIAATVSMAAFVEVLDTSVANVALPYIAGGLGASYDDSTWVLTSYLAANAIVLPISGWLAEMIGRKRYFMISLAIFTVSSLLCGFAPKLPLLLFFRAVQGIGGGGLQPMAQAILNDTFPPEQRGRRLLSMALLQFSPLQSGRCWEAGLPTTIPGAGYFSSRCPRSFSLFI